MAADWGQYAQKLGPTAGRLAFNAFAPAAETAAEEGGLGLSNLGGASLSALAPYLPVVGIAAQMYNAFTGGSHRNEPLEKRAETQNIGKLIADLLSGKQIDWTKAPAENLYGGVGNTYLPTSIGGGENNGQGLISGGTIDPRGPKIKDLYNRMIEMSSSMYQPQGLGNSGWSGSDINNLFGPDADKLAKAMNLPALPDWSKYDKGSGWGQDYLNSDPVGQAIKANQGLDPRFDMIYAANPDLAKAQGIQSGGDITASWNALDDATKDMYRQRARVGQDMGGTPGDDTQAVQQMMNANAIKELNDKYNMGLPTYEDIQARQNSMI